MQEVSENGQNQYPDTYPIQYLLCIRWIHPKRMDLRTGKATSFIFGWIDVDADDCSSSTKPCSLSNLCIRGHVTTLAWQIKACLGEEIRRRFVVPLGQLHQGQIWLLLILIPLVLFSMQHQPLVFKFNCHKKKIYTRKNFWTTVAKSTNHAGFCLINIGN